MFESVVNLPKTRAGQFFKKLKHPVHKEKLTSYGSQALVRVNSNYVIVNFDRNSLSFVFQNCLQDKKKVLELWDKFN